MKYTELKRGVSPDEAAGYIGSKELLRVLEKAGWVKPFVRGNRLTRYDLRDLDHCIERLKAGEPLPREERE
jgi:ribosomal protein S19E (S16A)